MGRAPQKAARRNRLGDAVSPGGSRAHPDKPAVQLGSRPGRAIIAAAVLGSALAYMSDDMLNVALPSVSRALDGSISEMQWVVNGYFVTMLSLMLTAGSLGDIRGHRRTFLTGLGVFSVGAVVAAAAASIAMLVAGRAIQGVGAALLLASGLALVNGSFSDQERSQAVGVYMGVTAVATAAGPAIGGLLVDVMSWRAIFIAPLLFSLAAAVVTVRSVAETAPNPNRVIDTKGALLVFLTISSFSFALIRGPTGWLQIEVIAALTAAVAGGWAFIRSQRLGTDPMLPLALFRKRAFTGGNAVTLISFMVSAGVFLFVVVQLQITLGYRPAAAGAALVPLYLIMLVGSPLAGRLADRIGPRIPIVAGNLVLGGGIWWLSVLGTDSRFLPDVLPGLIVLALGLAMLGAPLTSATLSAVGEHQQGVASGVNNTVGQLAGLLMIVVLPAVAGLSGHALHGPEFADGFMSAMRFCAALCLVAAVIAAFAFRSARPTHLKTPWGVH